MKFFTICKNELLLSYLCATYARSPYIIFLKWKHYIAEKFTGVIENKAMFRSLFYVKSIDIELGGKIYLFVDL